MPSSQHSVNSSYREKIIEHLFIADVLRNLWQRGRTDAEVLTPEVDNAGYDLVLECNDVIRHIQLKSSHVGSTTSQQKVNVRLSSKPSGCVVWLYFDSRTLDFQRFLWYGGNPNCPLPDMTGFRVAKHTKANSKGQKTTRPNIRVITKGKFEVLTSINELVDRLFAPPVGNVSSPK